MSTGNPVFVPVISSNNTEGKSNVIRRHSKISKILLRKFYKILNENSTFFSYHIFLKGCQSKFRFWWNMYLRSLLNMYHTKPTYVCKYVHKCTYVYYYRFNNLLKLNLLWTKKMATATIVWQFTLKTFQIISSSQVKSI